MSNTALKSADQSSPSLISRLEKYPPLRTPTQSKGQPYLQFGSTGKYSWLYNDSGSGADMDVTLWRPTPDQPDYYIVGDYAQGNYGPATGRSLTVSAINDPDNTLLQPPVDYALVWTDKGSGGDYDGSVWYPVPPDHYVSLGFVGQMGYNKPSISYYRCVHMSLLQSTQVGALIWSDKGSGADTDVSLYANPEIAGSFLAQANYNPYSGPVYQFKTSS